MSENVCVSRLSRLREYMAENGVDAVIIPTADYHNSEYAAQYFCVREYFCGFTGENASLVVLKDEAALWVDGRFFIQADRELLGSGVVTMKMGEPGVPTLRAYLKEKLSKGSVLGFDGRCITLNEGTALEKELADLNVKIDPCFDAAKVWTDRPSMPNSPVWILDAEKYAGEETRSKLGRLRAVLEEKGADCYVSSKLDEIMWLYNLRGNDVECNPVALSYTIVNRNEQYLFIQDSELTDEVRQYCEKNDIRLAHYFAFEEALGRIGKDDKVLIDPENVSYSTYSVIKDHELIKMCSPLDAMKAVKNETEINNFRSCYIEDSAALTRFIYWLKKNSGKIPMTERSVADHLDALRAQISDFVELSFGTISAYGENAAMMHYDPGKNGAEIKPEGMLLVDSGGHYLRGTTDVTRTIAMGPVTDDMKKSYTLTAVSCYQLMGATFLYGINGLGLDILAREPMWQLGMDYKCGTGHGIGNLLNVHEGPQTIRYKKRDEADVAVMEPGVIISDEPGVYKAGQYGIRIETIILCKDKETTSDGRFLCFEPLTFVPLDRDLIDPKYLTDYTRGLINEYHKQVVTKLAPFLTEEENEWLRNECKEI